MEEITEIPAGFHQQRVDFKDESTTRGSKRLTKSLTQAITAANEGDLSPGLRALIARDPVEQAAFWKSCVSCTQGELDALEALCVGSVSNDVLIRYFDPSARSISKVFNTAARMQSNQSGKDVLHKDGLYIALSDFYAVFEVVATAEEKHAMMIGSNKEFERVCETVSMPCSRDSFGYALRCLRIAILLRHFDLETGHDSSSRQGHIYQVDYDTENIWSPFSAKNSNKTFDLSVIEPQFSSDCFSEFLFNQKGRRGDVHWEHVEQPNMELILAIGQVWHLPAPQLAMMFDLEKVQAQVSVPDKAAFQRNHYAWSFMILPAIYLDKYSRESLQCYRNWYEKRRDPSQKKTMSAKPPRVRVAATYSNLAMLWTAEAASSLVTVSSDAHYIGKWNTDKGHHKRTWLKSLLAKITCEGTGWCCSRRKKEMQDEDRTPHEGKPLLGKDEDLEKSMRTPRRWQSTELQKLFDEDEDEDTAFGETATDATTSIIKFEDRFEQVLAVLQQPHSVLRLGSHWDLLLRICASRTHEYLDVLEIYEAAIARLTYLLNHHRTDNKDNLIGKMEQIKMELSKLEMLVKPFADCVVGDLIEHMDMMGGHHRVPPQMREIQNNILAFQPKLKSVLDNCTDLCVQYDRSASDKMNNILNILTFITFVITPMQLMTGIYGMNWDHMPELHWSKGYHFFWVLSVVLSIVFALILICLQRTDRD